MKHLIALCLAGLTLLTASSWAETPPPAIPSGGGARLEAKPWLANQPRIMKRRFADIAEGQVHYWQGGPKNSRKVPLLFMHPGPQTARVQVPLLDVLAENRPVYAPDLMGMGDPVVGVHQEDRTHKRKQTDDDKDA